ncbi:hypothetical protein GW17_00002026 [Ensete ventricosum]|nr:hypothetical protein GW17_00002026 [Ensete ventricosum]
MVDAPSIRPLRYSSDLHKGPAILIHLPNRKEEKRCSAREIAGENRRGEKSGESRSSLLLQPTLAVAAFFASSVSPFRCRSLPGASTQLEELADPSPI